MKKENFDLAHKLLNKKYELEFFLKYNKTSYPCFTIFHTDYSGCGSGKIIVNAGDIIGVSIETAIKEQIAAIEEELEFL